MPRPRRDSEILPAKDRLEESFWELLANRDFQKITVTDVVREANVNRNSFYYHFSGLPELADAAILREIQNLPTALTPPQKIEPKTAWREYCSSILLDPEQRQRVERLSLLMGPHSSPELQESLQDFCRMALMSVLDIDAAHVDIKTALMVDFTVGGLLSVLKRWPSISDALTVDNLMDDDLAILAMGLYLAMSKEDMTSYWRRTYAETLPRTLALQHTVVS